MSKDITKQSILSKVSAIFVNRYRISILITLSLLAFGALAYTTLLPREGFPSIEVPFAIVKTPYFVNDVNKVDKNITKPLETALKGMDIVASIDSQTYGNFSILTANFNKKTNSKDGAKLLQNEIRNIATLPKDVKPEVISISASKYKNIYDIMVAISGDHNYTDIQKKAKVIAQKIEDSDAVDSATVINVIENKKNPITRQVQTIQNGYNRVTIANNGDLKFQKAITIGIIKKRDSIDTISLSKSVHDVINSIDSKTLDGYHITFTADFAKSLDKQIKSLENNAVSALVVVIIILFLLVNWRASFITAGFIVLVMATTMVGLYLIGFSLNVLSLFALILVLGLIVDDAIVIVDAIDYQKKQGVRGIQAITNALNTVGLADISGSITTILVFIPMAGISGVLGSFIKFVPYTVILALTVSIVIGLTIVPFVSLFTLSGPNKTHQNNVFKIFTNIFNFVPNLVTKLGGMVSKLINTYLSIPLLGMSVLMITIVAIIFGFKFSMKLPFKIFPSPKDSDTITVSLVFSHYINLKQAGAISTRVENTLLEKYSSQIVSASYLQADNTTASINVELTPLQGRTIKATEIINSLNDTFRNIEKTSIQFQQKNKKTYIIANFIGINDETEAKNKIDTIISKIKDLNLNIESQTDINTKQIVLIVNKTGQKVLSSLEESFGFMLKAGIESTGPPRSDFQFSMQVFSEDISTLKNSSNIISKYIQNWELPTNSGIKVIAIKQPAFSTILKKDGKRFIQLSAKLTKEADTAAVLALGKDIKAHFDSKYLESLHLSKDALTFDLGQESKNLESFTSAITTTMIALVLMYILLVIQFDSFSLPLLVFSAVPFSFPGLFPGLYITNNPLSFFTMIGIIGLIGIVVNNTIILLEYAKQARSNGMTIREAIVNAVKMRFRPLLTTSLTTVVGLIPLAISDPFWETLSLTIIFGLASSTLLVIFVFPVFYMTLEYLRYLRTQIFKSLIKRDIQGIKKLLIVAGKKFLYPLIK